MHATRVVIPLVGKNPGDALQHLFQGDGGHCEQYVVLVKPALLFIVGFVILALASLAWQVTMYKFQSKACMCEVGPSDTPLVVESTLHTCELVAVFRLAAIGTTPCSPSSGARRALARGEGLPPAQHTPPTSGASEPGT